MLSLVVVIKESEMMLGWSAEPVTEISLEEVELEFTPILRNTERGVPNLEFVLQQMHTALMAFTRWETNDIVSNSRKNPLEVWRRLRKTLRPDDRRERVELATHDHVSCTISLDFKVASSDGYPALLATRTC